MKALGLQDRALYNSVLRSALEANPRFLGVWSVWQPDALDGRDRDFAGSPGHDGSGRFVPFWHRAGGVIRLEANTNYDDPEADWYRLPACSGNEVVIDPYEYPVGGARLFITSQAAPIQVGGRCVGVVGFDVHMDTLLDAERAPQEFEPFEAAFRRGHILVGSLGEVRYCSTAARQLICRYVGGRAGAARELPEPLHELVLKKLGRRYRTRRDGDCSFPKGMRKLVVRFSRHPSAGGLLLLVEEKALSSAGDRLTHDLSEREQEVAGWMCQGKSNEEIAIILGISAHTVKNHLEKVFKKLGVENRHAAALAMRFPAPVLRAA